MALILEEPGWDEVREVIHGDGPVLLPFVGLMEVEYRLRRRGPGIVERALSMVDAWPAALVESNYPWRRRAAAVKAEGRLSLADAWVAALALLEDADLVHKDPEFDGVAGLKHLRLPYTERRRG